VTGSVRVGCIGTVGRWLVPLVLERVRERHPKVHIVVVDATTTSLLPQLLADRLELAIVNLPLTDPDVLVEPLFDEDRLVVAPDNHPLAKKRSVTIPQLAEHELLLEPPGTAFRDELDQEASRAGVQFRPQAEVDGLRLIASLAFEGFGAAIVPATAVPAWLTGQWSRVDVEGLARRQVGLVRRRRGLLAAPGRAVRDIVREVVTECAPAMHGVHSTL
jgi:LysR family hydrogen peroxide-inducible transcriptional activator